MVGTQTPYEIKIDVKECENVVFIMCHKIVNNPRNVRIFYILTQGTIIF